MKFTQRVAACVPWRVKTEIQQGGFAATSAYQGVSVGKVTSEMSVLVTVSDHGVVHQKTVDVLAFDFLDLQPPVFWNV